MLIHKKSKKIVLNLRDPSKVLNVIPTARAFQYKGRTLVAVPAKPEEVKVLNNMGYDVPNPILHFYEWPGQFMPFEAQLHTADFLTSHPRAFCLNDMGTGKTLSTLWSFDFLRQCGVVEKALVITPLSTLERTWGDEIFRNFPHLNFSVLHGTREKRLKLLNNDADIYLINHDGIKTSGFVDALASRDDIDLVVIDEVASFRNSSTERWKCLNAIVNKQCDRRVWGLTGTPTPNAPTDAWAQCRIVVPQKVPQYFGRFRDAVMRQVTQFKWVPRDNALDTVHQAMQPSIRYRRDECVDLPPVMYETRHAEMTDAQKKAYRLMLTKLAFEVADGQVLAVNEAVKASKLVQIACIAYNTPVLTDRGWVPIQNVSDTHKVWDGEEWVSQAGSVYKGFKQLVTLDGVRMTPDHKVLTDSGWVEAGEVLYGNASERFNRVKVRLPDRYEESWVDELEWYEVRNMGVSLRLRNDGGSRKPVPKEQKSVTPSQLWVPSWKRNAQDDEHTAIPCVVQHEASMLEPVRQGLAELRRARDNGVRAMDFIVSKLPRRYFRWLQERLDSWPEGQRRPVLTGELSMGDSGAAGKQQTHQQVYRHTSRAYDSGSGSTGVRDQEGNTGGKTEPLQVGCSAGADRTYDLINCGPRARFVVQGQNGELVIVHNCGAAYDTGGGTVHLDVSTRIEVVKEIIDEAGSKVLVFVPFTAALHHVAMEIAKHFGDHSIIRDMMLDNGRCGDHVAVVEGATKKADRDTIFTEFQKGDQLRVLVANPGTLSHGLTLTAANTIVWFAPPNSNEQYEQANARITRPGQKLNQLICHIEGSDIECRMYERLKTKQSMQNVLLEMLKDTR